MGGGLSLYMGGAWGLKKMVKVPVSQMVGGIGFDGFFLKS